LIVDFFITNKKINISKIQSVVEDNNAGGYVFFEGRVRIYNRKKKVYSLFYEADKGLAKIEFLNIVKELKKEFSILQVLCVHKTGVLLVGETALFIGILSKRRKDAFLAVQYLVSELKRRLPVFKKETYIDNSTHWVNNTCSCDFTVDDNLRYQQQKKLSFIGENGQKKLLNAKVLVVGAGGLGVPVLTYLASAGIGHLGICEYDRLDVTNLNRQFLYRIEDIGKKKSYLIKQRILEINKNIQIKIFSNKLTINNIIKVVKGYDIIIDCVDNLNCKFLLNDAAYFFKIPLIRASVYHMEGQLEVYDSSKEGPCFRCFWNNEDILAVSCNETGVLGTTPGLFGIFQAQETIKFLLGENVLKNGEILIANLFENDFFKINYSKNKRCSLCCINREKVSLINFYHQKYRIPNLIKIEELHNKVCCDRV